MKVNLVSYGAAEEVTGSRHVLDVDGRKLLVDCGSFQGKRDEADAKNRSFLFDPGSIASSICTHGHFDHCGSYPTLVKKGFKGSIFCTPATRDLMSLVLMDSAHIQQQDLEHLEKKADEKGEPFDKEVIYTAQDVQDCMQRTVSISYGRSFEPMPGTPAVFHDAGHILGSSMLSFVIGGGDRPLRVGFTGDLGRKDLPILRDPEILPPLDYLVCESTYGDRLHDGMGKTMDDLAAVINETFKKGGKIIIPAFAVERTQEIIYHVNLLLQQGRIPRLPVFIDSPMAVNATEIFRVHPECFDDDINRFFTGKRLDPFSFDGLKYISSSDESKALNGRKEPMIIIAGSGMCETGRILHHLANEAPNPASTILIVGFMAENTLGRNIADREKEIRIFGEVYPLRATVKILNAFSAHADYNEIRDYLSNPVFKGLKGIFLVHGEKSAQENLIKVLNGAGFGNVLALKPGEAVALD